MIFSRILSEIKTTNQKNPTTKHYVYLDSSNSKINCRERFYQKLRPTKIIELNFCRSWILINLSLQLILNSELSRYT